MTYRSWKDLAGAEAAKKSEEPKTPPQISRKAIAEVVRSNPEIARLQEERKRLEAKMASLTSAPSPQASPSGRVFPVSHPADRREEMAKWSRERDRLTQKAADKQASIRHQAYQRWSEERDVALATAQSERKALARSEDSWEAAHVRAQSLARERAAKAAIYGLHSSNTEKSETYQEMFDRTRPLDKAERLGRLSNFENFNRPKKAKPKSDDPFARLDKKLEQARHKYQDSLTFESKKNQAIDRFSVDIESDRIKHDKLHRDPLFDLDIRRKQRARSSVDELDQRQRRALEARKKRKLSLGRFA